ncbi:hypothetical protein BH24ACT5_BH24ACT5_30310 [soil metagenome]
MADSGVGWGQRVLTLDDLLPIVDGTAGAVLLLWAGHGAGRLLLRSRQLGWAERLAATIALSLSAAIVVSLVLYLLPWPLEARRWAAGLGGIGLLSYVFVGITGMRDENEPSGARAMRLPVWRWRDVSACAGIAVTLIAVVVVARQPLEPPEGVAGYTQLWLVPGTSDAQLGVASFELESTEYTIELSSDSIVLERWTFRLAPNGEWTRSVPLTATALEALLFRAGETGVYRRVNVLPESDAS